MGERVFDERLTDVVLEGLTDDYELIKYNAERDPDFSLEEIEVTMRNMHIHANSVARRAPLRKWKDCESAMVAASLSSNYNRSCHNCGKQGHFMRDYRSKKWSNRGTRFGASKAVKWCSIHLTDRQDNVECIVRQKQRKNQGSGSNDSKPGCTNNIMQADL